MEYIDITGNGTNDRIPINIILQPGEEVQNLTAISNIVSGNYYSVVVIAQTQNGQLYDTISNVLAVNQ
ncbi:hypothetical protein [Metallosphaera hakonensis]|uniref:hypothetical protein n=1 Tax=Metallosphaera hakonensis TaxID=79601 RepID=UPI000A5EFC42|nr:hypothetical protein [Metallosphaera hakonensis]